MYAAVAFAAALFLLTAGGLAERQPPGPGGRDGPGAGARRWRVLAWAALGTGGVLAVVHVPLLTVAVWLGLPGAALAFGYLLADRATGHRSSEPENVRSWAELVGGSSPIGRALVSPEVV